jgi:tRNA A-37 threonylcarbamoyl transferase component Bud32
MPSAFFGCRTVLVWDAAALRGSHDPNELDESALVVDEADVTIGELIHRCGTVRVCMGDGCETHVSDRFTIKRARHSMLVEARVHAIAHRAAPEHVAPIVCYLRAPGEIEASAIVSATHGVDGYRFVRGGASVDECLEWTASIARAARALAEARIVHGDLKLNNTCLANGEWRVIDFGHGAVHGDERLAPEEYIYDAAAPAQFSASFDMRVFIWSCIVHAPEACSAAWDAWRPRFEAGYSVAWRRAAAASRSGCARLRLRALHAMYQPVYAKHDPEFEPSRVLETIRALRAAPAERDGGAVLDAP